MIYPHKDNILNKMSSNYKKMGPLFFKFYNEEYIPMSNKVSELTFDDSHIQNFKIATDIFNNYYNRLIEFRDLHEIKSQSKWDSSFLEEISSYLFKDLSDILSGELDTFNKKIYAGIKIDNQKKVEIITKDVDFCIGKKVTISISGQDPIDLILPIIAVEVKTYLDATMFGEVKSSSKSIRSASPNSNTYILMGYKNLADEHLIAARQDSTLTEIFVLRKNDKSPMDSDTLYNYWKEVSNAVKNISDLSDITVPGRILKP